jgi:hypothetical protein
MKRREKKLVEHEGIAPSTPVWKTGMFLSTLMLGKLESRAGIAPAFTVLQTVALAARLTGRLEAGAHSARPLC